jgi:hypothetical protein
MLTLHDQFDQHTSLARALSASFGTISLGQLADLLNRLGHATVQSIDRV